MKLPRYPERRIENLVGRYAYAFQHDYDKGMLLRSQEAIGREARYQRRVLSLVEKRLGVLFPKGSSGIVRIIKAIQTTWDLAPDGRKSQAVMAFVKKLKPASAKDAIAPRRSSGRRRGSTSLLQRTQR